MKKKNRIVEPSEYFIDLLVKTGDKDILVAQAAQREFAKAMEVPMREAVLVGDILGNIFTPTPLPKGTTAEYPTDLIAPGMEGEHVAYTNPGHGRIPERSVESDYIAVKTYSIASSIDWLLRYSEDAKWDIASRAMNVMASGFVKKMNDDGWSLLIAAGTDRNILVYDGDATASTFTKRLVSLMQNTMLRNSGGNSSSIGRGRLTDLYVSPEALENIKNWGMDQVDEITRREFFLNGGNPDYPPTIFGVRIHALTELGSGMQYQEFYENELGGELGPDGDTELVIGLDLSSNDSFVMPIRSPIEVFEDPLLHRQQRVGFYGWTEIGFAALDNRRIILGSF